METITYNLFYAVPREGFTSFEISQELMSKYGITPVVLGDVVVLTGEQREVFDKAVLQLGNVNASVTFLELRKLSNFLEHGLSVCSIHPVVTKSAVGWGNFSERASPGEIQSSLRKACIPFVHLNGKEYLMFKEDGLKMNLQKLSTVSSALIR